MKLLVFLLAGLCSAYLAICATMFIMQRKLIYKPSRADLTPAAPLEQARKEELTAEDGTRVTAWFVKPKTREHKTLIYAHGNAGNLHDRTEKFAVMVSHGYGLVALSYRGYGDSQGEPTEKGLIQDFRAAWDFARRQGIDPENIICYGESLGTGVTVAGLAAHQLQPAFIVLEAPFMSLGEVASSIYPWLPAKTLLLDKFDTMSNLDNIKSPVMVIHGELDSLIPLRQGRAVYEQARSRKAFRPLAGTGHTDFNAGQLLALVEAFDAEIGKRSPHETLIEARP